MDYLISATIRPRPLPRVGSHLIVTDSKRGRCSNNRSGGSSSRSEESATGISSVQLGRGFCCGRDTSECGGSAGGEKLFGLECYYACRVLIRCFNPKYIFTGRLAVIRASLARVVARLGGLISEWFVCAPQKRDFQASRSRIIAYSA